jgi:uncharacterized repeat protein (TIGR01451 family)
MQRYIRVLTVAAFAALFAGQVQLARAQAVELVTKAEKEVEVMDKGAKVKKLLPADKLPPGGEVLYTISYSNKTAKPAEKVVITNPVPAHTRYKDGSAAGEGTDISFSADGGKTFATADKLTVSDTRAGAPPQRPASASDYSHIRWTLRQNVAPGQSGSVRYRTVIQ